MKLNNFLSSKSRDDLWSASDSLRTVYVVLWYVNISCARPDSCLLFSASWVLAFIFLLWPFLSDWIRIFVVSKLLNAWWALIMWSFLLVMMYWLQTSFTVCLNRKTNVLWLPSFFMWWRCVWHIFLEMNFYCQRSYWKNSKKVRRPKSDMIIKFCSLSW